MLRPLALLALLPGLAYAASPVEVFDRNVALGLPPVRGQIVLSWEQGADLDAIERHAASHGCALDHRWGRATIGTWRCDPRSEPRDLLGAFAQQPGVTFAQIPFPAEFTAEPDDLTDRQWHHRNTGQRIAGVTGTPGADIRSVEGWAMTTGGPDIIVAVPDTGVYLEHAELLDRIALNEGEICDNGIDDDGNGYIDDCTGWDMGDGDPDPDPRALPDRMESGAPCPAVHGTFISGLIAGAADNGAGIAGLVWDGRILPLKIVDDATCGITDTQIAEALRYAGDRGARITNVSWNFSGFSPLLQDTFEALDDGGMIFAMAAGNNTLDLDATPLLPLRYDLQHKLVVAATDNRDRRAGFSNWGATSVDLGAPGWQLWSAGVSSPTHHIGGSGTSYAAPLVAGVAALIWSEWPFLRAAEVRRAILDGAAPVASLDCAQTARCVASGARLDAAGALDQAAWWATSPQIVVHGVRFDDSEGGDGDGVPERGERVLISLDLQNVGHGDGADLRLALSSDHPYLRLPDEPSALGELAPGSRGWRTAAEPFEVDLACLTDLTASLVISVIDDPTGATTNVTREVAIPCVIDDDDDGWLYPIDCDDLDPWVNPGMPERCTGVDDDCDGRVDIDAIDAIAWYPDADGDGHGAPGEPAFACAPPPGFGWRDLDCDDARADVHPGAPEVCDGVDNSCDGLIDFGAIDARTFFIDRDGDGWGRDEQVLACEAPRGTAERPGDCDDDDPAAFPGSDSHDEDCQVRRTGIACDTTGSGGWPAALLLTALLRRRRSARCERRAR